jgi:hypothetical protein
MATVTYTLSFIYIMATVTLSLLVQHGQDGPAGGGSNRPDAAPAGRNKALISTGWPAELARSVTDTSVSSRVSLGRSGPGWAGPG